MLKQLATAVRGSGSSQALVLEWFLCHGHWAGALQLVEVGSPLDVALVLALREEALLLDRGWPLRTWEAALLRVARHHDQDAMAWYLGMLRWGVGPTLATQVLQQALASGGLEGTEVPHSELVQHARACSHTASLFKRLHGHCAEVATTVDAYLWSLRPLAVPPSILKACRDAVASNPPPPAAVPQATELAHTLEDAGCHAGAAVTVAYARCGFTQLPVGHPESRSGLLFAGESTYLAQYLPRPN
jgi:hypothetical protein